jgi:hypothetical protein
VTLYRCDTVQMNCLLAASSTLHSHSPALAHFLFWTLPKQKDSQGNLHGIMAGFGCFLVLLVLYFK